MAAPKTFRLRVAVRTNVERFRSVGWGRRGLQVNVFGVLRLGGFPLRERHLVSERFQTFDQVTPESDRIQGVKIVASQFVILQALVLQQVVEHDQQRMGYRHDRSLFAPPACQATELGAVLAALRLQC